MKFNYKIWSPLVVAVTLTAGIWVGYLIGHHSNTSPAQEKLNTLFSLIRNEYVDDISLDSLVELSIPEILKNLDPHSAYIPVADLDVANRDLESSFFGVGIQFQMMNDTACVMEVVSGGPAEKVGLLSGDRIIAVDGKNMTGPDVDIEDVFKVLRGDKGTKVDVTVKRSTSRKPLSFTIVRDLIPNTSIDATYLLNDSVGYVKVRKFARNTYAEFLQSLNKLRIKGATSFVIDLRGNGGGYMEPAILMANEFLPAGCKIVETRGRNLADNTIMWSDGTGSFTDFRLVVLIDEMTASASEIFSGAIQDNDRGMIIGRRSFGKGLVQRQIDLPDSSQLRLTVQRYYTPSGRCIQKTYKPGHISDYETEILERYNRGEVFSADSVQFNTKEVYETMRGRTVYGGGGIMPDVFVPSDTSGVSSYYINVANAGLLQKFAYDYADLNRDILNKCDNVNKLLRSLPSDYTLLTSFVNYSAQRGVAARWYYINISRNLIVSQLKALIARDILGIMSYYEIVNLDDTCVGEALKQIARGNVEDITSFGDFAE
jgi:carboxyl-terminal processing protease